MVSIVAFSKAAFVMGTGGAELRGVKRYADKFSVFLNLFDQFESVRCCFGMKRNRIRAGVCKRCNVAARFGYHQVYIDAQAGKLAYRARNVDAHG